MRTIAALTLVAITLLTGYACDRPASPDEPDPPVASTPTGQVLAAMLMIIGYSVIAVPTGIVSAEVASSNRPREEACRNCGSAVHSDTARFCDACGIELRG